MANGKGNGNGKRGRPRGPVNEREREQRRAAGRAPKIKRRRLHGKQLLVRKEIKDLLAELSEGKAQPAIEARLLCEASTLECVRLWVRILKGEEPGTTVTDKRAAAEALTSRGGLAAATRNEIVGDGIPIKLVAAVPWALTVGAPTPTTTLADAPGMESAPTPESATSAEPEAS